MLAVIWFKGKVHTDNFVTQRGPGESAGPGIATAGRKYCTAALEMTGAKKMVR